MSNFPYPIMNISSAVYDNPEDLVFVFPKLGLLAGTVGCISAPGASGKSWLSLQLAAFLSCNFDTLGLGNNFGNKKVLILAAEDPKEIISKRIYEFSKSMNPLQKQNFIENVTIATCLGAPGDFMDGGKTAKDISIEASQYALIIVDTLSRWHSGQENERKDAACVMRQIELIAKNGPAVIFLHHTGKSTVASETHSSRGSSVWTDEARWVAYLEVVTEKEATKFGLDKHNSFVRFGVSKVNYQLAPDPIILKRGHYGQLIKIDLQENKSIMNSKALNEGRGFGDF